MQVLKAVFFLLVFLLSVNTQGQDLETNVTIDALAIYTFDYGSTGDCYPASHDVTIQIDSTLYPFATGVKIALLVDGFSAPLNTVLVDDVGPVTAGDRLLFSGNRYAYTFRFLEEGTISIALILSGTPLVYQENYFCSIEGTVTEALCGNHAFIYPTETNPECSVGQGTSATNNLNDLSINIYPNPIKGDQILVIDVEGTNYEIEEVNVYDINGRLIRQESINSTKKLSLQLLKGFPKGTYLIQVNTSKGSITKKIFN